MARSRNIFLILGILGLFVYSSHSIVQTKILQLRLLLAREQLLNYELSSRMLRARFRQMLLQSDDTATEMRLKVLESSVLNFNEENRQKLRLSAAERIGLGLVNAVRGLAFKPFLRLEEEEDALLVLQYAFYMERTRKYDVAAAKYEELEERFASLGDENYAFILLHGGFCLALFGETAKALEKLELVQKEFPGSHYETNATILIEILRESLQKKEKIEKQYTTDLERARAYFAAGQFSESLKAYEKATGKNIRDNFNMARSFEETGQTGKAVQEYMALMNQPGGQDLARQANRRLLMIGNFYDGGEELKTYAEEKAQELGDTVILKDIQESAQLQLSPTVIEKIEKGSTDVSEETVATLNELKTELEQTLKVETAAVQSIVIEKKAVEEKQEERRRLELRPIDSNYRLQIVFLDGRKIQGHQAVRSRSSIHVSSGQVSIRLPFSMLKEISLPPVNDNLEIHLKIGWSNSRSARSIVFEEETARVVLFTGEEIIERGDFKSADIAFGENVDFPLRVELDSGRISYARSLFFQNGDIILNGHRGTITFPPERIRRIGILPEQTIELYAANDEMAEAAATLDISKSGLSTRPGKKDYAYTDLKAAVPRKR
ncbi:MAG: hypothetical protein HS115_03735 [Spirochaetales bacterium]|nr:hypothetical protein [Spirochaetales bacterium]